MKSIYLKITLMAFVAVGSLACKNTGKEAQIEQEEAAVATEGAVEYVVDTDNSSIKWEGSKPGTVHYGTISVASGAVLANNGVVQAGKFAIDMQSIVVEDLEGEDKARLEAHLTGTIEGKEGDFFNATEYPSAKFEMTGVENNAVRGNLTIKDQTHAVEFPATVTIEGDTLLLKSEAFEIDRTKWGVNFGSKSIFPNLGDKFVSDTMKLTVSLQATKA
ncbi:MAG: YceI family protein [Aequorivita sp.]